MPDYYVPPNRPEKKRGIMETTHEVRCPHCGSTRLYPTSPFEASTYTYQCGQCGERYRVRARMPTWGETLRDPAVILGIILLVIIVVILFLG